jgi:hypothetical protein
MKTLAVLLFLSSFTAMAKDIECLAAVNQQRESFDTKVPREPDSVSHVIGLMIFEAQTVNDQGIKLIIADAGRGGYGSAIAILAPGQTLTYVTNDHVINTLTCVYK